MLANTGLQAAMSVHLASSLGILTTLQPHVFFAHSELKARVETSMVVDLGFSDRSRDREKAWSRRTTQCQDPVSIEKVWPML